MKKLKEYILESLLDDEDDLVDNNEELIRSFLEKNYEIKGSYTIKNGIVDTNGHIIIKNRAITSLTNGLFEFGRVGGDFYCSKCDKLSSLEGAPKEVDDNFYCSKCNKLTSLEGAPEKVNGDFDCSECNNLISLEGAPKKIKGYFYCSFCPKLKSLEGASKAKKIFSSYSADYIDDEKI